MKLIDILQEAVTEYKVSYTVLRGKDFSKGAAIYKDEADARKFYNDMVNDEEVISAKLEKIFGADSSKDALGGAAKYLGGSEGLEYYSHPAAKGVAQGGKHSSELTPQELNIRTFLNSPSFISKKKGFTNKDGSDSWFQEGLEENKIEKILGDRNYKYIGSPTKGRAIVPGPMPDSEKNQLIKKARQIGYIAKPNMGGGVTIFIKENFQEGKDAFSGYFSKASLGQRIIDAEEILASGIQNGEPLDNETEMLVRQELERLKQLYVDNHGYTGMMASAKPEAKKEKVINFLKKRGY